MTHDERENLVKGKMMRPEMKVYVKWVKEEIQKHSELFGGYTQRAILTILRNTSSAAPLTARLQFTSGPTPIKCIRMTFVSSILSPSYCCVLTAHYCRVLSSELSVIS